MKSYKTLKQILLATSLSVAIIIGTTPVRFYDLRTDLLVSPLLFLLAGIVVQFLTKSTFSGLLSVVTGAVYIAILISEAGFSNISSIPLIEVGFVNVISWLILAWLGQITYKVTGKHRWYVFALSLIIIALVYQYVYPAWYKHYSSIDLKKLDATSNYSVSDPDGTKIAIASLAKRKKYVIIDFWFQQCIPCWQSLQDLNLRCKKGEVDTSKVYVHTVNLPTTSDKIKADSAFAARKIVFPISYIDQNLSDSMGLSSFPTYFLFGEGRLILTTHEIDEIYAYLQNHGAVFAQ
jgi:hypothetical protein